MTKLLGTFLSLCSFLHHGIMIPIQFNNGINKVLGGVASGKYHPTVVGNSALLGTTALSVTTLSITF
jgi:hypothetical protein